MCAHTWPIAHRICLMLARPVFASHLLRRTSAAGSASRANTRESGVPNQVTSSGAAILRTCSLTSQTLWLLGEHQTMNSARKLHTDQPTEMTALFLPLCMRHVVGPVWHLFAASTSQLLTLLHERACHDRIVKCHCRTHIFLA